MDMTGLVYMAVTEKSARCEIRLTTGVPIPTLHSRSVLVPRLFIGHVADESYS